MPRLRFHIYTLWLLDMVLLPGLRRHEAGEQWHTDPRLSRVRFTVSIWRSNWRSLAAIVWFVWTHIKRASEPSAA